jgi:oxygen-independent coproporphyrinogen-3 oxidase
METIYSQDSSDLPDPAREHLRSDYIYMYPPRQSYQPFQEVDVLDYVKTSLAQSDKINLYAHFPFCRQVCAFCNLFVSASDLTEFETKYVDALLSELSIYAPLLQEKHVDTIYLGGGTPSLLKAKSLNQVLEGIAETCSVSVASVPEVSLEVSPETVDVDKLTQFHDIGINRLNFGMQSAKDDELQGIGRSYGWKTPVEAIERALSIGFSNTCVDLIYGLKHQTDETWIESVTTVAEIAPETICIYALTLRPRTGFAAKGYQHIDPETLYRRYDIALNILFNHGYEQENHVRFVKNTSGGYIQKANHWAGENVLGIGAGARSYLKECDLRNGYSTRQRRTTIQAYMDAVTTGELAVTDGYLLTEDEKRRRRIILGLFGLDRSRFKGDFGMDPFDMFESVWNSLIEKKLVCVSDRMIALTELGARYRDNIAQVFFSAEVSRRIADYGYDD